MSKLVAVFAGNVGIAGRIWLTEEQLWTYFIATFACGTGIAAGFALAGFI